LAGPLDGIRVVDLSERSVPAALLGLALADYGATVVRVEPTGGDELRCLDASRVWFRGQQSVTERSVAEPIDGHDAGCDEESLRALCERADIVIDTAQAWVAKRFRYPAPYPAHQVVCVLTAMPIPAADVVAGRVPAAPVYGELAEAQWGFMYVQDGHREAPIYLGWPHAAFGTSWIALSGVLAALWRRLRNGRGQVVTTSLLDGLAALNTQRWVGGGDPPLEPWPAHSSLTRMGDSTMIIALVQCADGEWIQFNSGARGATNRMFEVIGRADLVHPSYELPDAPFVSREVADEFWDALPGIFQQRTAQEWVDLLQPLDISVMPVRAPGAILETDHARRQGLVQVSGGDVQFGIGARFSRTPAAVEGDAPAPGAHNEQFRHLRPLPRAEAPAAPAAVDGPAEVGGPLAGLTVLDLGVHIAGPFTSRLLADLGARVVKVDAEDATVGRTFRGSSVGINRGKRNLVVDLKTHDGQQVLLDLAAQADVVHQNLRNGVMERLGLGARQLLAANPRLVFCQSSGYGNEGPWADLPAWGPLIDATAGMLTRTGGHGRPPMHYATHVDYGGALSTAPHILEALVERERSGSGQAVEHPQLASAMWAMSDAHVLDGVVHETFPLDPEQLGHSATNALYRTADGWITLSCFSEREWRAAVETMGVACSSSYAAVRARRVDKGPEYALLAAAFADRATTDALRMLGAAGVPAAEPTALPAEALDEHGFDALGLVVHYEDPRVGYMFEIGPMVRFSETPTTPHRRPTAALGQHSREILAEFGFAPERIDALVESGVVVQAPPPVRFTPAKRAAITPGQRLLSTTCTTQVVVVHAPRVDVTLFCGGAPMREFSAGTEPDQGDTDAPMTPDPAFSAGTALGKRYEDDATGLVVLVTRAGRGSLSVDDRVLGVMQKQALPSSD
jgi:crotonobetainyl-CoA:carnitine CoA-transferase CaiB-like acyl-CoA transferase